MTKRAMVRVFLWRYAKPHTNSMERLCCGWKRREQILDWATYVDHSIRTQTHQPWLDYSSCHVFIQDKCKIIQKTLTIFLLGATKFFVKCVTTQIFHQRSLSLGHGEITFYIPSLSICQVSVMCKFIISHWFWMPAAKFPCKLISC